MLAVINVRFIPKNKATEFITANGRKDNAPNLRRISNGISSRKNGVIKKDKTAKKNAQRQNTVENIAPKTAKTATGKDLCKYVIRRDSCPRTRSPSVTEKSPYRSSIPAKGTLPA